jgi:hypothetical protein
MMEKYIRNEAQIKEWLTEAEVLKMLENHGVCIDINNTLQVFLRVLNAAAKRGAEARQKEIVEELEKMSFYYFGQDMEIESAKEMARDDIVDIIKREDAYFHISKVFYGKQ